MPRKNRTSSKDLQSWWKEKVAKPISKIDGFVKNVYREHKQEADHWANIGSQGQRKIVLDTRDNSETWKAVKGCWDGSFQDNGSSGCCVVIKGVDRERWVTISKIAIPLKVGTAMSAEVAGVCVLTVIVDLIFCKCLCVQNANQCINRILNNNDVLTIMMSDLLRVCGFTLQPYCAMDASVTRLWTCNQYLESSWNV